MCWARYNELQIQKKTFFDMMICVEPAAAAWAHLESEHGCSANTPTLQRWKGNTDIWQKYWQSWRKYRYLTEMLTSWQNTNIWHKCWQNWRIYRNLTEILTSWRKFKYLTEMLTKLTEKQIFDRNTDKVDRYTDILQIRS